MIIIMMNPLDSILELLRDSRWHSFEEIEKKIPLPAEKLEVLVCFLQEQKFINRENDKLRIKSTGLKFLELPS